MADQKIPCKVYYARDKKPPKVLMANSQKELEGFLRIGWTTEEPK